MYTGGGGVVGRSWERGKVGEVVCGLVDTIGYESTDACFLGRRRRCSVSFL